MINVKENDIHCIFHELFIAGLFIKFLRINESRSWWIVVVGLVSLSFNKTVLFVKLLSSGIADLKKPNKLFNNKTNQKLTSTCN